MDTRLTDAAVKKLPLPAHGNRITYDPTAPGFGVRVTANGHRGFILTYRNRVGRQRRYTIGSFPDWSVVGAREEARRLKREIDQGHDPLAAIAAERSAPDMDELLGRFLDEHVSRLRAKTQYDYRGIVERHIRPALGRMKVGEVSFRDVDALHRKITKAGRVSQANRVHSVLSKLFTLAVKWRLRSDNPAKGVERNLENKRRRYLKADELRRLLDALDAHDDQQGADVIRLCLFTGCRSGEAMGARFAEFEDGVWSKPAHRTKQKRDHSAPLSAPARELLRELRRRTNSEWVFPARIGDGHRVTIQKSWRRVCKVAGIKGVRVHDLRHSFASTLVSSGASLPLIGSLLGHSNPTTTARYAHLFDDPQKEAVERVGRLLTGGRR